MKPVTMDGLLRPGEDSRTVHFSAFVPEGQAYAVLLPGAVAPIIVARHPADLTPAMLGTRWHVAGHCPTWVAGECRCMVEGVS